MITGEGARVRVYRARSLAALLAAGALALAGCGMLEGGPIRSRPRTVPPMRTPTAATTSMVPRCRKGSMTTCLGSDRATLTKVQPPDDPIVCLDGVYTFEASSDSLDPFVSLLGAGVLGVIDG